MPRIERDRELAKRRKRKAQIKKYLLRYVTASGEVKETIAAKIRRMSPFFNIEERATALVEKVKAAKKAKAKK